MKIDLDNVITMPTTTVSARGPSQRASNRTTVPKAISDMLALKNGDQLRWFIMKNGTILVDKVRH